MLTVAFGESTISWTWDQVWCKQFKEGRDDVNDDGPSGRMNTSTTDENIEAVEKIIMKIRRIIIREVAAEKIVPKFLNFEQKQRHTDIAQEILVTFNDDPDLLKKS